MHQGQRSEDKRANQACRCTTMTDARQPDQNEDYREIGSIHSSPTSHGNVHKAPSSSENDEDPLTTIPAPDGDADQEASSSSEWESESDEDYAAVLDRFREIISLRETSSDIPPEEKLPAVVPSFDLAGIAQLIAEGRAKNIIVMCGAGISVSAGIPDFRSPGTGLYDRLQEYNLPHPQAVFEIDFFKRNPNPFYLLAKELFPGNFEPTPTHHFIKLLHDKKLLKRCYTQNIDSLEHQTGLPKDAVIAAHGNFDSASCISCKHPHSVDQVKDAVFSSTPLYCTNEKKKCKGLVKPDIVFFGESLPKRFWTMIPQDFAEADLLIVMGTSLVVQPFASLIDKVSETTPRVLINRECVGEAAPELRSYGYTKGFEFGSSGYRDVFHQGDCDDGVMELCDLLGWKDELDALIASGGGGGTTRAFAASGGDEV